MALPDPPTFALPVLVDEVTKRASFNPIWLNWFLSFAQLLREAATGSTAEHNNLLLRQGGNPTESYHFTSAEHTRLVVVAGLTLSGSNTGDQTITLTGDVTGSGTGSFAATIANNAVSYAKMQDVSAASKLLGRGDSGSGDPQEITIGSGLSMTGTTLSATGSGTGDVVGPAGSVNNNVVLFDGVTGKLIKDAGAGLNAAGVGLGNVTNDVQTKHAIVPNTVPAAGALLVGNAGATAYASVSMSGDATMASTGALTLGNEVVSYAKMQNVSAASKLLGRGASGAGDVEEITLGTNLSMSGTTLNASGGSGGDPAYAPGSITIADGTGQVRVKRLELVSTEQLVVAGTGRLVIVG